MATEQPPYGAATYAKEQQRGRNRRRALEQARRTAAGAMGQTSQQILAGTPAEFQPEMGQKERLQLQGMVADMYLNLDKVDMLREKERSVSQREMSNVYATLAGQQADIINQGIVSSTNVKTAQIGRDGQQFAQEMKRLDRQQLTEGYFGTYSDQERANMRAGIEKNMGAHLQLKKDAAGNTVSQTFLEPGILGSTVSRKSAVYEWTRDANQAPAWGSIGQSFDAYYGAMTSRERALFNGEFRVTYPGARLEDVMLTEGSDDAVAQRKQIMALANTGEGKTAARYLEAEAYKERLQAQDEQINAEKDRLSQEMRRNWGRAGVPQSQVERFEWLQGLSMGAAQPSVAKTWLNPPGPNSSLEERNEFVQKEYGGQFIVGEDGAVGTTDEAGQFSPVVTEDGQALSYEMLAPPLGRSESETETVTAGPGGEFSGEIQDYLQEMWVDLQTGTTGGPLKEFMENPEFLSWATNMGYINESSTPNDVRWAARQLIKEAKVHNRDMRKGRRHQRDVNIASGKALATPGQKRRATRRVARESAAISESLGRTLDPGTGSAQVMGEGIGGDGSASSVSRSPVVTEADAAAAGTAAEAASTPGAAVEEAPVDFESNITSREEGDAFRAWVNEKHPNVAKDLDLDASGNPDNSYIREAWDILGEGYEQEQGRAAEEAAAPEVAPEYQYDPTDVAAMEAGMMDDPYAEPEAPPAPGEAGYAPAEQYEEGDTGEEGADGKIYGGQEAGDLMAPTATEMGEGRRPPGLESAPTEFSAGAKEIKGINDQLMMGALEEGIITIEQFHSLNAMEMDPADLAEAMYQTSQSLGKEISPEYAEALKQQIGRSGDPDQFVTPTAAETDLLLSEQIDDESDPQKESRRGAFSEPTLPGSYLAQDYNRGEVYKALMREGEDTMAPPIPTPEPTKKEQRQADRAVRLEDRVYIGEPEREARQEKRQADQELEEFEEGMLEYEGITKPYQKPSVARKKQKQKRKDTRAANKQARLEAKKTEELRKQLQARNQQSRSGN